MFNKNDFDSLLKNVDIDKFEKVDFEDVGLKNELRYYREHIEDNKKIHLSIDNFNNSMHYSLKRGYFKNLNSINI